MTFVRMEQIGFGPPDSSRREPWRHEPVNSIGFNRTDSPPRLRARSESETCCE